MVNRKVLWPFLAAFPSVGLLIVFNVTPMILACPCNIPSLPCNQGTSLSGKVSRQGPDRLWEEPRMKGRQPASTFTERVSLLPDNANEAIIYPEERTEC